MSHINKAVMINNGDKQIIPIIEASTSNARLIVMYVLRIKPAIIPKIPLPNKNSVDGSGARARGFSKTPEGNTGTFCICVAETISSPCLTNDNVAHAVVTQRTQTLMVISVMAALLIFVFLWFMFCTVKAFSFLLTL